MSDEEQKQQNANETIHLSRGEYVKCGNCDRYGNETRLIENKGERPSGIDPDTGTIKYEDYIVSSEWKKYRCSECFGTGTVYIPRERIKRIIMKKI